MKISISTVGFAALLVLSGCAGSGLESYDTSERGPAPYAPNYTQHLNSPYENPRTAPGGRY